MVLPGWSCLHSAYVRRAQSPMREPSYRVCRPVTMGKDAFANADEVAQQTVFGPGIIEVN